MKRALSLLLSSYVIQQSNGDVEEAAISDDISDEALQASELYSACNGLENGPQWIRPFEGTMENGEEWPNIKVRCQDGWTILDYDLDSYISNYFSSFQSWTEYAASSKLDDRVTWREWFLPATEDSTIKFRLSENCNQCTESDEYGDDSAYYMTGNYIGCLWVTKGYCDMDPDSLECYTCSVHEFGEEYSGLCTHMEMSADSSVYTEHDMCTTNSYNAVPSLGTNNQYCVCYQPESATLNEAGSSFKRETISASATRSGDTEVKLYNTDFESGTYRITEPGTYILQENINLNMNAPDSYDSPNAAGAWYPDELNSDYYEGADGSFVGAYSMGFFAGIAIESSDVTIDLNGFKMKMSKPFHLQQRWFSLIEIGSKAFISGQGPGNFGAFLVQSENIVIKNGVLGLTSHHGIHGNSASQITISDMTIRDFEVAGIALNGFTDVTIEDVIVGPCNQKVPVLGLYTQARIMLPRMRAVAEDNDDTVMLDYRSSDRQEQSMSDLEESLERQMDVIFDHVIKGEEFDDDNTVWSKAKSTFINDNGYPSASTVYGIFLNSRGASVFAVGGAPGYSYNAVIKNVNIMSLINDPWEVPRIMNTKGPFNDIVDVTRTSDNGMTDIESAKYIGNAYSDAQYALNQLTDSWAILSHSAWTDPVVNWIEKGQALSESKVSMKCNNDIMLHVTKGVFGLRIDNIDNFEIENVIIEDLQNIGYYGSTVCGNYMTEDDGGHRNQRAPMQSGYTGTEMHGIAVINSKGSINNLEISKLISARGDASGLKIYPGNEIELGKITIKDIHAGAYASSDDVLLSEAKPNKIPRGCAIDYWTYYDESDDTLQENVITYSEDSDISAGCVSGLVSCSWTYSEDLITDINECSVSNGNLIDSSDIVDGQTYHAIVSNNAIYSGMIETLETQDSTRDNGNTAKAQALIDSKAEGVDVGDGDPDGEDNGEVEAIIPIKKGQGDKTIWIYIVIIAIVIATCLVGVFRKCLRSRQVSSNTVRQSANSTIEGSMKSVNRKPITYSSVDSAEYTPLIHTGPAF